MQEVKISVVSRFRNTTEIQAWLLFVWLPTSRRETNVQKERKKRRMRRGNEGFDREIWTSQRRKLNLLRVQRTSLSSGHSYRASTPRRLYRRPLCGLLLAALVFINGVTCFRSRFYVGEILSTKNAIRAQTALLNVKKRLPHRRDETLTMRVIKV